MTDAQPRIDFRSLLKQYMDAVLDAEGITYSEDIGTTPEEKDEMNRITAEVIGERRPYGVPSN